MAQFKVGVSAASSLSHSLTSAPPLQEFFENPAYRSDGLKLYPTLVIRGTGLYELWKTGKYKNYTPNALVDIVARIMALVPPWTRVYRVQRDIPMPLVSSGVENGNLRELALGRMRDFGAECRDIRYREVGVSAGRGVGVPVRAGTDFSLSDTRDPQQGQALPPRAHSEGLCGERWVADGASLYVLSLTRACDRRLGDVPLVRGRRAGRSCRSPPASQVLGGGHLPQGARRRT